MALPFKKVNKLLVSSTACCAEFGARIDTGSSLNASSVGSLGASKRSGQGFSARVDYAPANEESLQTRST